MRKASPNVQLFTHALDRRPDHIRVQSTPYPLHVSLAYFKVLTFKILDESHIDLG